MNEKSPPKKNAVKRRLYNLIYKTKKKGYPVKIQEKTIFCRCDRYPQEVKQIKRLRSEFGFVIQFEI